MMIAMMALAVAQPEPTALDRAIEALQPPRVIAGEEAPPQTLYEMMAEMDVPAVSIALVDDNEIVAARSFGWADPENRVPAHLDTRFQAASLSKAVAAYGFMALSEREGLDLDLPVDGQLTSWNFPAHEHAPPTIRTLLSHRAGVNVGGFPGYGPGEDVPSTAGVLEGAGNTSAIAVTMVPGDYSYSGGGFTVAQLVAEEHEKQPFEDIMRRMVLAPLGMDRSTYAQPPQRALEKYAIAHDANGRRIGDGFHIYPEKAAAGLWATPSDLARFLIAANETLAGASDYPVSPDGMRALLAPPVEGAGYALGFGIDGEGEDFLFSHGGSNAGFKSLMVSFPEREEAMVIMTSGDRGAAVFQSVANALAAEMGWPGFEAERIVPGEVETGTLEAIAGGYRLGDDVYRFAVEGDQLRLTEPDGETELVLYVEGDSLYLRESDQLLNVDRDDAGDVTGISLGSTVLPKVE